MGLHYAGVIELVIVWAVSSLRPCPLHKSLDHRLSLEVPAIDPFGTLAWSANQYSPIDPPVALTRLELVFPVLACASYIYG